MDRFLQGFADELTKVAFGPVEAARVSALAKKIKLPKGSSRILGGIIPGEGTALGKALQGEAAMPMGGIGRIPPQHARALREGTLDPESRAAFTNLERMKKRLPGPGGTGIIRGRQPIQRVIKQRAANEADVAMRKIGPKNQRMVNQIIDGHELDETMVRHNPAFEAFGHRSPDVILREHNRLATLPKGYKGTKRYMQQLRTELGPEADALAEHGIAYGKSPRLSRHARKRIVENIDRRRLKELAEDLD